MESSTNFLGDSVDYDFNWEFISIFGVAFGVTLLSIMLLCFCAEQCIKLCSFIISYHHDYYYYDSPELPRKKAKLFKASRCNSINASRCYSTSTKFNYADPDPAQASDDHEENAVFQEKDELSKVTEEESSVSCQSIRRTL